MTSGPLECTKCGAALPPGMANTNSPSGCPRCGSFVRVDIFPALFKKAEGLAGESLFAEAEAGCFFHPHKKAAVPCGTCGRFICSLCDVELGGGHICPACLEAGKSKRKIQNLETHRVLHDNIALALAVFPLLIFWFTILTAPACIYYSLRHWRSPTSILPRTKLRFVIAILIAALQVGGWFLFFGKLLA